MNCFGYARGAEADRLRALITEYASRRGILLEDVLIDPSGEYSAFRALHNAIKYGLCDTVILPSYDSLADDRYLMLENRLFLLRNGVKPVFIEKGGTDNRHEIALGISRYTGYITDWDASYGVSMPLRNSFREFKRTPPFGYRVKDGEAVVDKREAKAVKEIFSRYASGVQLKDIYNSINSEYGFDVPLGNMTVKTILKNERYLGRMSKKGYHLPPLIRYEEWLAAKERLEREYGADLERRPFFKYSSSDVPIVFFHGEAERRAASHSGALPVDLERIEREVCGVIASLASAENAEAFYSDHVLTERKRASLALPKAEAALGRINKAVYDDLNRIKAGDRSIEVQKRLEKNNDIRIFFSMRVRRIRSEIALYSSGKDRVKRFFDRVRRIDAVSFEEKSFMADVFISSALIRSGSLRLSLRDPKSLRRKTVFIDL